MTHDSNDDFDWSVDNRYTDIDFSDPCLWQHLSLCLDTSLTISQGFPHYWKREYEVHGVSLSRKRCEQLAETHRAASLKSLANAYSPLPDIYESRLPHATKGREVRWDDAQGKIMKPGLPAYNNPYAVHWDGTYRVDNSVMSLSLWADCAKLFYDGLTHEQFASYSDEFLPQIGRHGKQLSDGALYQGGSRLADQHMLETVSGQTQVQPVRWGPLRYEPQSVFDSHFCVVGKPRTGKTVILKLLFQSICADLAESTRFVFYDAKPDLLPFLTRPEDLDDKMDATELSVYLLHPFDQRSTAWDIAKDASSRAKARSIANVLFPNQSSQNEFFGDASQVVAATVMDALNRQVGDRWTFYDLLTALRPENVEAILKSNPYGAEQYKTYFQNPTASSSDLIKTLANKTDLLLPAAYAWTHATQRLSLTDWVQSQTKSIVLANNDEFQDAVTELNRILLNLLCRYLLTVKPPPARTFLYLDEVEHLGHIVALKKIGQQGASRQVHMALSLHSLDTLKTVYGQETEGILGDCAFKAFLSVENRHTADWASDTIGTQDVLIDQSSKQSGSTTGQSTRKEDSTETISEQTGESVTRIAITRKLVPPNEIMRLPLPGTSQAVTGYFMAPTHFPYKGTLPLTKLICSRSEYLNRRDIVKEEEFYALWPEDMSVRETVPQPPQNVDPPDDSFANLHGLEFPKPGYPEDVKPSPATQPPPFQPPENSDVGASKTYVQPPSWPKIDLDDLDFGFDLEDE